ncbi:MULTISPECIES: YlmC/YmxH family sporulation protein [Clostridium]|uniref:PRC-barrel domain protein n=2 Tax=Clostridium TaxID=1485 RepID=A0A151AR42_9CLOT|nr:MULTISPECIES: YlmC/YmxH family sporulation protein [Clostridium]MBE6079031.1 YlmC/YmxH family sporulation protein [Clostridium lundense]KYH29877.1 PRC-barrel domain protein [Clostridium colicanis DSM 13634]MBE6042668.1 YlmC/YmxH family sporulation protein [Clostridium thermopalmarium]PRR75258.1 PRC-barrel domain protein [Clostridium thermopalmarium DSM 5974]PVZ28014.1 YlmC/YmxH family sporulation protein [Clostridium thermopalmarium DSM 5974]
MDDRVKLYSDIEKYEIINISNGEKYNYLYNNDIIIDEDGNLKLLVINNHKSYFSLFKNNDLLELPWEYVNKIGTKTIIIDVEESQFRKSYK